MGQKHLVQTKNLTRVFEFGESLIHALNGVNLDVEQGEFIAILGPSGAGKTTLLNMIGGIDHPTGGEIIVDGEHVEKYSNKELNTYRREKIGWIFQFFNIVDSLRAWENVGLAREFQGIKNKDQIKKEAFAILERVGLKGKETRFPSQLSGGEQQRVAIARALIKKPILVVADEPTGNLDFVTGQKIAELMKELNEKEGVTFIVVSHDISITKYAKRVYHLKSGKIEKVEKNQPGAQTSQKISQKPFTKKVIEE